MKMRINLIKVERFPNNSEKTSEKLLNLYNNECLRSEIDFDAVKVESISKLAVWKSEIIDRIICLFDKSLSLKIDTTFLFLRQSSNIWTKS